MVQLHQEHLGVVKSLLLQRGSLRSESSLVRFVRLLTIRVKRDLGAEVGPDTGAHTYAVKVKGRSGLHMGGCSQPPSQGQLPWAWSASLGSSTCPRAVKKHLYLF